MGSLPPVDGERRQPHVVMIPYPAQGHVTPMLQLAKLLHSRGFHVTFVNNDFNHRRHLRARGPNALDGAEGFRFATIDDGLPPSEADATQDVPALCHSTMTTCLPGFKDLIARINAEAEAEGRPTVTCVVGDSTMTFALRAARELSLRCATLWTASACGFICCYHYRHLVEHGIVPLKSEAQLTDGYLDTVVDWIPGAPKDLRLLDFPSFVRTTDPNDIMLNFFIHETAGMSQASAVVINTFDELDATLLDAMAKLLPPIYTVGPFPLMVRNNVPADSPVAAFGSNLWKEQEAPLRWLDGRAPRSVVYVNFGSITVMSNEQLVEFAWGLGWPTPVTPSCGTCAWTSSRVVTWPGCRRSSPPRRRDAACCRRGAPTRRCWSMRPWGCSDALRVELDPRSRASAAACPWCAGPSSPSSRPTAGTSAPSGASGWRSVMTCAGARSRRSFGRPWRGRKGRRCAGARRSSGAAPWPRRGLTDGLCATWTSIDEVLLA